MSSSAHALAYSVIFISKVKFRALFAIKKRKRKERKIPLYRYMQWISNKDKQTFSS